MSKMLRKLSLVRLKKKWATESAAQELPFLNDMPLIYLGEIPNMPEHGVFAGHRSGRLYSGYHIGHFVELSKSEV
jgi:hypothetical protein